MVCTVRHMTAHAAARQHCGPGITSKASLGIASRADAMKGDGEGVNKSGHHDDGRCDNLHKAAHEARTGATPGKDLTLHEQVRSGWPVIHFETAAPETTALETAALETAASEATASETVTPAVLASGAPITPMVCLSASCAQTAGGDGKAPDRAQCMEAARLAARHSARRTARRPERPLCQQCGAAGTSQLTTFPGARLCNLARA